MTTISAPAVSARATPDIPASLVNSIPPVPASGRDHAAWMAATLEGQFYLAWLGFDAEKLFDSQCILRYSPDAGTWETVYQKTSSSRGARQNEQVAVLLSAFLTSYPSGKNGTLYARFASPLGERRVCSAEGGAKFRSVRIDSQDFAAALALREMVAGPAAQYALFTEKGRSALRSQNPEVRSPHWTDLPLPVQSPARPPQPSHIALFNERLVLATDDPRQGFDLWAMEANGENSPDWTSLLTRGGHRYSMNAQVFACLPWKDALYLACGRSEPRRRRQYQEGFEILRVYSDGSWDVVVGAPRVTSSGLKIPLACLGPGMDEFDPARFCFLSAAADELLLGTYDDVAGFRLWRSRDGESWSGASDAELVGLEKVCLASAFPISKGTVLFLELENSLGGRTFNIWFRAHGSER